MASEIIGYILIFIGVGALCSASFAGGAGLARWLFPPADDV